MRKLQLTEKFKVRKAEEKVENGLQIFNFKEAKVRVVMINDEAWFIAKDVCDILEIGNTTDAMKRLDEEERTLVSIEGASNNLPINAVNESGLYELIFGSRKKEAKEFKRWIKKEVLPSIRKTGSYSTQNLSPAELFLQNAQLFMEQERKLKAIESRVEVLDDKIEVVSIRPEKDWRDQTTECLNEIAKKRGGEYREVRTESYDLLDERMRVDVHARLKNKKKRMAELGISKSSQNKVTILDVIEDDPKLIEGYISVVKDMYLSY